jgi:phage gp37-like protein
MIAEIEDALVAAVNAASFGYALGTVAGYGGELGGDDKALALLIRQFPAVWVTFKGESDPKPVGTSKDKWRVDAEFLLLVATHSPRGERFTRHSANATTEIGAYQIIKDARLLLLNQDLDLAIAPFKPGAVKSLFNKKLLAQSLAVFSLELKTQYVISQPAEASQPDWLRTGFNYYLKPGDNVADASDLITLRAP